MANIDMAKVIQIAERDEFWATRGKAIQAYANLEQRFAELLATLSGMDSQAAATILFRIASSDARNKILQRLFRQKFGEKFRQFANTLFDQLRPLDIERNEIVHWNTMCQMGLDNEEKETAELFLMPPALRTVPEIEQAPRKDNEAILNFSRKCGFYTRLIGMFCIVHNPAVSMSEADKTPWFDIFERPVVYPPPPDHLLFLNEPVPENLVRAFLV